MMNNFDPQMMGGLFGGGAPPQASQLPGVTQMPRFGQTPLQGMGLGSPFFTERPQQAMPTQNFMPSRNNAMGPNAMAMMGMSPNMPNMVGPPSALPAAMQPQQSQLQMYGMQDQLRRQQEAAQQATQAPGVAPQSSNQFLQNAIDAGMYAQAPSWVSPGNALLGTPMIGDDGKRYYSQSAIDYFNNMTSGGGG
jgi:hypothetical protein